MPRFLGRKARRQLRVPVVAAVCGGLIALLSDDAKVLKDSELVIEFPHDRSTVKKISVIAKNEQVNALFHKGSGSPQITRLKRDGIKGS